MHRFFLPPSPDADRSLVLRDDEAHHARDVLRLGPGDAVRVLDGAGVARTCVIRDVSRREVGLDVQDLERCSPPVTAITLLVGIPKGKLLEDIVDRATQLGVARIVPVLTERVVVQLDADAARQKLARWRDTAITTLKQCDGRWLPEIELPLNLAAALARFNRFDWPLVAALTGSTTSLAALAAAWFRENTAPPATVGWWIGPEGDFSPGELERILAAGAQPVTLGPRVLRVETACLAALAMTHCAAEARPAE